MLSFIGKAVFSWNLLSTLQKKRIRGNGIDNDSDNDSGRKVKSKAPRSLPGN